MRFPGEQEAVARVFPGEQEAVAQVKVYGEQYGYGNLIHHLKVAWAEMLVRAGLDEGTARYHVGLEDQPAYRCPRCGATTRGPEAARNHYCADCDKFDGTDEV